MRCDGSKPTAAAASAPHVNSGAAPADTSSSRAPHDTVTDGPASTDPQSGEIPADAPPAAGTKQPVSIADPRDYSEQSPSAQEAAKPAPRPAQSGSDTTGL